MGLSKQDLEEFGALIAVAEEVKPIIKKAVEALINYGPELRKLVESVSKFAVENKVACIKQYRDAGFSEEDAITMTLDQHFAIARVMNKIGKNKE